MLDQDTTNLKAPTIEALGEPGRAFLSVYRVQDGVGSVTLDIDASNVGGHPWESTMIHDTAFFVPNILLEDEGRVFRYNFTVGAHEIGPEILNTLVDGIDPWSYMNWATFATEVEAQQYPTIVSKLSYYSALFNVSDKYGRPIDGSFMIFMRNLIPVNPPEILKETPEPTADNLATADRGYAYWVLLVRLAVKNSPFDSQSTMLASLNNFIKFDITIVKNNIGSLVDAIKSEFQTGQRLTQSNAAARHGMNYSIYHERKWKRDEQGHIIDNARRQITDWTLDPNSRIIKQILNFRLFANSNDIPRYHSGFWSFCDIGIRRHGWSAVEMMEKGLDNNKLTWNDIFIAFPTKEMITFIGTVKIEKQECARDFWRDTSHLLAPDINTPLSASKNHIIAYIGKCLNEPNLDPHDPPFCLPGTEIIDDLKIMIVKKVIALIIQNYTETIEPNVELLRELHVDTKKVEDLRRIAETVGEKKSMVGALDRFKQVNSTIQKNQPIDKYELYPSTFKKIPVPSISSGSEDLEESQISETDHGAEFQDD